MVLDDIKKLFIILGVDSFTIMQENAHIFKEMHTEEGKRKVI